MLGALGSLASLASPASLGSLAQDVPVTIETPAVAWRAIASSTALIGGAVVILGASALSRQRPLPGVYALATIVTAGIAFGFGIPLWSEVRDPAQGPFTALSGALAVDGFAVFCTFVICVAVILAALLSDGYLRREGLDGPEPYVLMLLSAAGGVIMAEANDLLVLFLGLEILSIAAYVLAAMHLRRMESQEAGIKYFVLGAFSSAFFLYGIALVYGAVGSTNLSRIFLVLVERQNLAEDPTAILLAGFALLLVGFGFKIAAVPFHSWTPDVYQGAPTPLVSYMASGVKVAAFAGLLRVFVVGFAAYADDWRPFVYVLAVATLLVGAVLAVVQTDVKRMLAYSSISHAGFILLGVQAATVDGISGALFYLAAYTLMVVGSFGVVALVSRKGDDHTALTDFNGLGRREPALALVFAIFLFAQAGVPLTSGFFAKFYVLGAAIDSGSWVLAICAMLSAVIAAFLYLRIVVAMYMTGDEGEEGEEADEHAAAPASAGDAGPRLAIPFAAKIALAAAFLGTMVIGFFPSPLTDATLDAIPIATVAGQPE